jgi:hypothetical protein
LSTETGTLSTRAVAPVAIGIRTNCLATSSCFGATTVSQALYDLAAIKLSEYATHLAHGRPHRVVGIVLVYFAGVDGEHLGPQLPRSGEGRLLDR